MDESDEQWIKSLLETGAAGAAARPVGRGELVSAGRARLARRRVLAGSALTAVVALVLAGYAVAATGPSDQDHQPGHAAVTASASSATASPTGTRTADMTMPKPVAS